MAVPPTDSTFGLASLAAAEAARPTELEDEVVHLFDQFRGRVVRYLMSFGLGVEDSEEIVQEVFLSLFQHLRRGKSRANLPAWIFRVAHNLALKRRSAMGRALQALADAHETDVDVFADPAPSPEERIASSQKQRRLWAAVHALPEQDRHCLFLRAEGLRYREIAQVLDMSLGAVSLSLGRSLARLSRAAER